MIIQCEKCGTKFRFNETLLGDNGIWLRCSRCKNIFFKDNPENPTTFNETDQDDLFEGEISSKVMEARKAAQAEMERDLPFKEMRTAGPYDAPRYLDDRETEDEEEEDIHEGKVYGGRDRNRGIGSRIGKPVAYAMLAILMLSILAIWIFPQVGDKVFQGLSYTQQLIRNITVGDNASEQFNLSQMHFENVKQRYMNNLIVGNIRIVEGTVTNQSKFYISKIKVQSELLDAYGLVLAQKESYCGNLLTDEELIIKTEDEILRELTISMGSDVSNEKVAPGGQIPFMIIFAREPAGVVKTTVTISGAERLLP